MPKKISQDIILFEMIQIKTICGSLKATQP